jgi:MFS transporter, MFS domain-containing protein family, molybdate-anion transporter
MARATLLNGFVATAAGVVSNELVRYTDTFRSPFVLAAVVLALSWIVIKLIWTENYGEHDHLQTSNVLPMARLKEAWNIFCTGE